MKTHRHLVWSAALAASLAGCLDDYLNTEPQTILTDEQVWTSPNMILGILADYYSRLPQYFSLDGPDNASNVGVMASYDDALWSGITGFEEPNQLTNYPYSRWALWNYGLIRDINIAISKLEAAEAPALTPQVKANFLAELRFQRAWTYFEHVKRMGGVPLITEVMVYDFSGDPSYLQVPRATEAEVYDFIASELDAIVNDLANEGSKTRANRWTALALKSRAMLYAGSLARHNNEMPSPITLPGGEVGIPASRANEYYMKSLEASREIINNGPYALYRANPHLGENFYEAVTKKSGNSEVIWVRDYLASQGRAHLFTVATIPRSLRIDNFNTVGGSGLTPVLQLVESYDFLDGSPGKLPGTGDGTAAGQANWIFYDTPSSIFEGKDWRLYGTVIYPGSAFMGQPVDLQAGVYVWNAGDNRYDRVVGPRQSTYDDGLTLTGADGPIPVESYVSSTGFYIRKYLDPNPSGATAATRSDMWWVFFRLGEIYLNAAEAAFELGLHEEALGYINALRERAGFPPNSLTELDRDIIRRERRVELAFEDHRLWDLKRWRIAHELWDGSADNPNAQMWVLYPYRVVRPGHEHHNKFVFDAMPSVRQTNPRFFRMGNYYSQIPGNALGNNPKLVANPFH